MAKWIEFREVKQPPGKTRVWQIISKQQRAILGGIVWYGPWRKYVMEPNYNTVWEQDCLRDVAAFIEEQTRLHKQERR